MLNIETSSPSELNSFTSAMLVNFYSVDLNIFCIYTNVSNHIIIMLLLMKTHFLEMFINEYYSNYKNWSVSFIPNSKK